VRPVYAGRPVDGDSAVLERDVAKWPALVADDVWQRVQDRLDGQQRMPRQASGQFLLTGLVRCPVCGGRMRGDGQQRRRRRYRCGSADPGKLCSQTADAERIEAQVLEQIGALVNAIATDSRVQNTVRKAWQALHQAEEGDRDQRIRQLESEVSRARQRMRRATEMFVDGAIDKPQYDDLCGSE